uniref:Fork-head domain-containing protein n=1 Tax=Glossina palpalis gambiensis TaxID=67801 RepID=A0A1B0APG4_9MUSC
MIDNVPVYSGANNTTSSSQQGSHEYGNFLKRKNLESETITGDRINSEKNNNNNHDSFQQQDLSDSQQNWKKRHLDNGATTLTTYENQPIFYSQTISETKKSAILTSAESGDGTIRLACDGDGDGDSYNIMTNSNFINDFLTYDANLLVPVTRNGSLTESLISSEESIFTTSPSTICVNTTAQFEDTADHWQASDLLELDHRYNSSLQTEITQLNPTLSLKNAELPLNNLNNDSDKAREAITFTTTQVNSNNNNNNNNFLIPARPESQHSRLPSTTVGKNRTNFMTSHRDNETDFEDKNLLCSIKASKKFEELVMEVTSEIDGNDMTITENAIIDESSIRSAKKPPFTYTELIEYALEDKGELTVSGIYQWIS